MKKDIITALTATFEEHANYTEQGIEFWFARDLQHLLGYAKWDNFVKVINKAKTSCEASGNDILDHFAEVGKMVTLGVPANRPLADLLPTITIKAKDFATEITIFNTKEKGLSTERSISAEHITNNRSVRKILLERGIKPEEYPAEEDIKKLERRVKTDEKKLGKSTKSLKHKNKD